MKKIYHLLALVILGAFTFTSCDDFLDMQPTNSGNAEGAVGTVADAQVVINGVMSAMTSSSYYGRNLFMYGDAKGGDLTIFAAGRGLDAFYTFNHTSNSNTYSGFWSRGYYCILQVNTLLSNIEKLEESGSMEDFSEAKGQALTLRALFYFDFGPSLRASLQLQQDLLWSSQCNRAAYGERPAHPCYCGGELSPDSAGLVGRGGPACQEEDKAERICGLLHQHSPASACETLYGRL